MSLTQSSRTIDDALSTAIAAEAKRSGRAFRPAFGELAEHAFRHHRHHAAWPLRCAVIALALVAYAALPSLLHLVGAPPMVWRSMTGLALGAAILPVLALALLTSAVPALARASDELLLLSLLVVPVATAVGAMGGLGQPLVAMQAVVVLPYLLAVLVLGSLPSIAATVVAVVAYAGAAAIWWYAFGHLRPVSVELAIGAVLVAIGIAATWRDERRQRRQWLCDGQLATSARRDYLTGLLNRRAFEAEGAERLARSRQSDRPVALLMLDVDYFKAVNDLYGHAQGDHVLKEIAATVGRAARHPGDLISRYGGEEFAILWTDCPAAEARHSAETLLLAIRRLNIENKGSKVASVVTASAGLIAWELDPVTDIQDGLNQADNLLYLAKRGGRNKLVTLKSAQAEGRSG